MKYLDARADYTNPLTTSSMTEKTTLSDTDKILLGDGSFITYANLKKSLGLTVTYPRLVQAGPFELASPYYRYGYEFIIERAANSYIALAIVRSNGSITYGDTYHHCSMWTKVGGNYAVYVIGSSSYGTSRYYGSINAAYNTATIINYRPGYTNYNDALSAAFEIMDNMASEMCIGFVIPHGT